MGFTPYGKIVIANYRRMISHELMAEIL